MLKCHHLEECKKSWVNLIDKVGWGQKGHERGWQEMKSVDTYITVYPRVIYAA